ncbi:hypothetical protein [Acidianus ambivalens]|uniref:Uncharacterized protein n=1 Tax=Acidianus ambivalens TaxID=2283 RepID=A0A650CV61_ACIAM|nr:hypothetical protein [Acidianus ambivalens]MQL55849.1 hypothetical protein [Acidianus ambivalens]QGR21585.1 hypothetical protein D1866_05950 [Acidianus ambivalens]
MIGGVRDRTTEALLRFGDRCKLILKAAISIAESNDKKELGDFDYKTLVEKLQETGLDKDPKMILRALERDYGIIETTYKSANQHWWRFINIEEVKEAIGDEIEDPEIQLIKIQANSLNLTELERKLRFMLNKPVLSEVDRALFKKIAFEELNYVMEVYRKASMYEETYDIAEKVKSILTLATKVSMKIGKNYAQNKANDLLDPQKEPQAFLK